MFQGKLRGRPHPCHDIGRCLQIKYVLLVCSAYMIAGHSLTKSWARQRARKTPRRRRRILGCSFGWVFRLYCNCLGNELIFATKQFFCVPRFVLVRCLFWTIAIREQQVSNLLWRRGLSQSGQEGEGQVTQVTGALAARTAAFELKTVEGSTRTGNTGRVARTYLFFSELPYNTDQSD